MEYLCDRRAPLRKVMSVADKIHDFHDLERVPFGRILTPASASAQQWHRALMTRLRLQLLEFWPVGEPAGGCDAVSSDRPAGGPRPH